MTNTQLFEALSKPKVGVCAAHGALVEKLDNMGSDIAEIKKSLVGNGQPGIKDRITVLETQNNSNKWYINYILMPIAVVIFTVFLTHFWLNKKSGVKSIEKTVEGVYGR